ncbi:MAG: sigma-70 family RNA polymerase sigma factor [Clostridia bacterium]|nr:sigma-70 family RNA polymerase sigma factor [Clostridia bacterium]
MSETDLENLTDERLAELSQGGDEKARDELVTRYHPRVRAIARSFFRSHADLDDFIQEGLLGLLKAIETYDGEKGAFRPYSNTCVRNKIIDYQKKMKYGRIDYVPIDTIEDVTDEDPDINPEERALYEEKRREFRKKLKKILSSYEYSVMIPYLAGDSKSDIAGRLCRDVKSVDNAVTRSYAKMGKHYSND